MRILVMGAGAIGSVVGGFLARAGHEVALVGRAPHMQAIAAEGLRISGIWGEHRVQNMLALEHVPRDADWDVILLTVKSYGTRAALDMLTPCIGEKTLVCAYQNGLGNAEAVAEAVGWTRTIGVRAIFGARIAAPGAVEVTVIAQPTALGVFTADAPRARVAALAEAMNGAGLPTEYSDAIETIIWAKVAYNCALNPLSALLDVTYGGVGETEHTRAIVRDVIAEVYSVGRARGVQLSPPTAEDYLELFYGKLLPPTAAHYASMREDLRQGRRTEIDALNGAIAQYGADVAIACPANTLLTRLIHAREHALGIGG